MELGRNINELRRKLGVTQEELAAELGVTAAAVSKWEKGYTLPDVLMVCALADYFQVTTDELLGRNVRLKKILMIMEDRDYEKQAASLARSSGYQVEAFCDSFDTAVEQARQREDIAFIVHIGSEPLTREQQKQAGKFHIADCVYDDPSEQINNLEMMFSFISQRFR